ncbi:MAG: pilus assembly protein PilM [Planctomycetes bacterium]|nr:pilus assembly protein PilM [Planctomycetota bacterium]
MRLTIRQSPVALHFGDLDARCLQLNGHPGGWAVHSSSTWAAQGDGRHAQAAEQANAELRSLRLVGKDALLSFSSTPVSLSLVPVDAESRPRLERTLEETAARAIQDPEGVTFRYLSLNTEDSILAREEYLLLSVGASEVRRAHHAAEALNFRPCGAEMSAFPIARALHAARGHVEDPWGFLHLGWSHSLFGIIEDGEIRFLKSMQLTGETIFHRLQSTLENFDQQEVAPAAELIASLQGEELMPREASHAVGENINANTINQMHRGCVGHAVEVLHSLRSESEGLAQEIRACLRHFAARHKGVRMDRIELTGIGASLPEVEKSIASALALPVSLARPFTALGIEAPDNILMEEHMWCAPLGLALRGYA